MMDLREAVKLALSSAKKETEVFASQEIGATVEAVNGDLDKAASHRETGLGVRVIDGGRVGFAHTNVLSPETIKGAVTEAEANAQAATPDPHRRLAVKGDEEEPEKELAVPVVDPAIKSGGMEERIELALSVAREGREIDSRFIKGMSYYGDSYGRTVIGNTNGLLRETEGTSAILYAYFTIPLNGDVQAGFFHRAAVKRGELSPKTIARAAAERALRLLGARSLPSGDMTVILEPEVAGEFLGMLAYTVSADAVQKGRSLLAQKKGERIASELVSITDDGMRPDAVNRSPFDGEGSPSRRTVVLEKGRLNSFLYDTYTAAVEGGGARSTGNANRGYRSTPSVGISNFVLEPGSLTPEEIIARTERGLLIQTIASGGGLDPISGQFSAGAEGVLIENGKLTQGVRGVAVAGNILDLLSSVDAVGNDLRLDGSIGSPTLRIKNLAVSGD